MPTSKPNAARYTWKKETTNSTRRKQLPALPYEIDHVSYLDGSKVYFKNGGWVVGRFSGTEPLIRIFCEMPEEQQAKEVCRIYEQFLDLN